MAATSSSVYQTNIPEQLLPYQERLLNRAEAFTDVLENPYQQYQGERVAQFSPLQQQAMETAGQLQPAGQIGAATDIAGIAGLSALGTQYDPMNYRSRSFTQPGAAESFMSPYMQNVVDVQQREAKRQADIAATARGAQAVRAGAFGGSRQAIENAEANRALQTQLGGIQATGLQSAFQQAQQQFNQEQAARQQAAQMREQSRQFGAGLGMQGLGVGLQAAGQLGQLGQQQFGQQQQAIQTQAGLGQMEQQRAQDILNAQYQDFLNYQNYPFKTLGFMSDILRGTPLVQTSGTLYQSPPSMLGVATGLTGAWLAGGAPKLPFKEGGVVNSYDDGGSVFSRANKERIVGDLHPMGLPRALQGAMMRGDMETAGAAQDEMSMDAAIRRGIAAAAPYDIGVGYADGGIVAFANGGTKDEEEATSTAGNIWRSITGGIQSQIDKAARAGQLREQMKENRVGFFEALTPTQRADRQAQGRQLREEYDRLLGRTPAAPKMTAYDGDVAERADRMTGSTETAAPTEKKAAPKVAPQINTALNNMSQQSGLPKETLLDSYTALKAKIEKEGEPDRKEYMEMMKSFLGEGKKMREGATQKALQEFFLNMAAQASQPGVARGRGIGQILQPAGAAAPSYMKALNESEKIAREMDSNDQKMMLLGKQFEMSQKAGDRKTALEMAMNMETIKRQQEQLQLERDKLAETTRYHKAYEGILGQRYATQEGRDQVAMSRVKANLAQNAVKQAAKDWADPLGSRELKKQYPSKEAYAKALYNQMWSQSMPPLTYQGTLDKDED